MEKIKKVKAAEHYYDLFLSSDLDDKKSIGSEMRRVKRRIKKWLATFFRSKKK